MSGTYSHNEGVSKKSKPVKGIPSTAEAQNTANKPVPSTKPAEIIQTKVVNDNRRVSYKGKKQVKDPKVH